MKFSTRLRPTALLMLTLSLLPINLALTTPGHQLTVRQGQVVQHWANNFLPEVTAAFQADPDLLWESPVDLPLHVLRPFDPPSVPWGSGHRGVDLAVHTEVRAPADATVHFSGWVVNRPVISLRHDVATISSFEPVTSDLSVGQAVSAGEVIGHYTGEQSHCDSPCVHWGVRVNGEYVNPLDYLQQVVVVLLE